MPYLKQFVEKWSENLSNKIFLAGIALSAFTLLNGGVLCAQDFSGAPQAASDGTRAKTQSEAPGAPAIVPYATRSARETEPTTGSTGTMIPPITDHGGPLMATPNVYLIWYGNWSQSNGSDNSGGQQIIRDFLFGLSGSNYYKTNTSYSVPTGTFTVVKEYSDKYSQGTRLSDSKVQTVVSNAIRYGKLPKDVNGIYFVLTSSDVAETSGFCSQYCGWHTYGTISSSNIKYAFVGNANRCLNACAAQAVGPNGNAGVDGMTSVIAHELEETNTDPNLNAWYDANGAEDADKCAWTFGSNQKKSSNGAYYNMTLIGKTGNYRHYLIQRELDDTTKCYVDYVNKTQ
jgi:hypothetical protein